MIKKSPKSYEKHYKVFFLQMQVLRYVKQFFGKIVEHLILTKFFLQFRPMFPPCELFESNFTVFLFD